MKIVTTMTVKAFALALALVGAMTPALAEQKVVLKDPHPIKAENWRGKAFYEILFMNRQADGGGSGLYYNSLGKDLAESNDVVDARFRALSADALKKEYGSDAILFNGPRRLIANSVSVTAWDGGKEREIAAIPFRVLGLFQTPDLSKTVSGNLPAYKVLVSKRSSSMTFNAGETVYELITPEGSVYTQFSLSLKIDPNNTIENLPTLGKRLTLPEGWQFRSRKLDKEMVLTATADSNPPNTIVLDQLEGNYQYNAGASQAVSAEAKVIKDGSNAKPGRVENMHLTRYIEMFLAFRDPTTGKFVAACYNPMFTSKGIPATRDTAPQALVEGLDFEKIKKEYNLVGASLNGPKLWTPDWSEVEVGVERDFNGIKAPWVAQLNMGDKPVAVSESAPYAPMTIARKSALGWKKGTTVLLLDDASGNTYVMKGFQVGIAPKYTYEQFVAAGQSQFKQLPKGWKFRVKTLDKELIETPENGVATIMPDEFFNVYDKTGPGMTNYKP